jgi:flagellar biogenesis protein FliO
MAPTSSQWVFYLFALIIIGGLFGLAAWLLKKANENAQKKKKDEDNRLG